MNQLTGDQEAVVLNHAYRSYIHMLLYARIGNGSWAPDDELTSFCVLMPDGEPLVVRINDEPHGWSHPISKKAAQAGDVLEPEDIQTLQVALPTAERVPFIGGRLTGDTWTLECKLGWPHPQRMDYLANGRDFFRAAELSLEAGLSGPFVENAFHAAESLAKAELISYWPIADDVLGTRRHTRLAQIYTWWARLGNTEQRFADLLNRLNQQRGAATYVAGELALGPEELARLLDELGAMLQHADHIVHSDPDRFNAITTRDIEAGELVSREDMSLHPVRGKP